MKKTLFVTGFISIILIMESAIRPAKVISPFLPSNDSENIAYIEAKEWVDSTFNTMSTEEKIAQMFFVRAYSNKGERHIQHVKDMIKNKKVGGLVFFQGSPVRQAELTNDYQQLSKVPLFVAIDAEWGLGMRLDSVISFPHPMMLGAVTDSTLIYAVGEKIGHQLKRIGAQINFGPVVDINNNPRNPVINDRSFGENKYRVARWGIQYMRGVQSTGVIAVAKHFPGHGDTDVDSHKSLPVISKSLKELKNLELYPFQQMINYGVGGVMTTHLEIPAIDDRSNRPMSLSKKAIEGLLKNDMGYNGLIITDGMDMQGVTKYYKNGQAELEAFKAGNDIIELPKDLDAGINAIKEAIKKGEASISRLNKSVKKILMAKYHAGLNDWQPVKTAHLTEDLNSGITSLTRELDIRAITVLDNENHLLPFDTKAKEKVALLTIGGELSAFTDQVNMHHKTRSFHFSIQENMAKANKLAQKIKKDYDKAILAIGPYHRYPSGRYGLSEPAIQLIQQLQEEMRTVTIAFGNPYAIKYFTHGPTTIAAYNAAETMQQSAADLLFGSFDPKGELPVSVSKEFPSKTGLKN